MAAPRILVLGIGNILWADEAFGVRAAEHFYARYDVPANVTVMDGGTQGLYLVQFVQEADYLLVFDAVDFGLEPGALKIARDDEVPKFTGAKKMSLHQTGFQDVLSAADLAGKGYPKSMVLIGCQAERLDDWGGPMSASVRAMLDPVIDIAVKQLADWGAAPMLRPEGDAARLLTHGLDDLGYEAGRPNDEMVFHGGDARILNRVLPE